MISVGITGQTGFIGTNLVNALEKFRSNYFIIPFKDDFFSDTNKLRSFVKECDVIVHLAAVMRSPIEGEVYNTNIQLVNQLIDSIEAENVSPSIIFTSSVQENNNNEYGKSKQKGKEIFEKWALKTNTSFSCMILPNVFGPYAKPNYSSFIATFCYKLINNEEPSIIVDRIIPLIYINTLVLEIIKQINNVHKNKDISTIEINPEFHLRVSEVMSILKSYKVLYIDNGKFPKLSSKFEKNLFTTFCSYL